MKHDLLTLLACPVCQHELELIDSKIDGEEILSGDLRCGACGHLYAIADGVADLRPPQTGLKSDQSGR